MSIKIASDTLLSFLGWVSNCSVLWLLEQLEQWAVSLTTQEKDKPDIGGFSVEGLLFGLELRVLCAEIYELCGQTRFWSVTNQSQHDSGVWDSNGPTLASTAEILQGVYG